MTTTLEIDNQIYNALEGVYGKSALQENLNSILISAIENKLEKYNRDILLLESKYSESFHGFAQKWESGEIDNPHGYEVESDYMDWEMLEMEKKDLLAALGKMHKAILK